MSREAPEPMQPSARPAGDRLLMLLKTRGPQTAAVLGAALGSTGEAARQQLVKLASEGLVVSVPEVRGVIFGSGNPRFDIPNLLALYQAGRLKLDELITRTYRLDQINQGYQDMLDGVNIRGVITFD